MNAVQLQKNVEKYEKNIKTELNKLSTIVSQINLKQFNSEDATIEIKKYKKSVENYKKSLNGLNTSLKFLKAQNVMTIEETMSLENLLQEFQNEFEETTKYVHL